MKENRIRFNLKVFFIDKTHYELKEKSSDEMIETIKKNHEKRLRHKYDDLTLIKPVLTKSKDGEFTLWSYCYNQPKDQNYWRIFLPGELTQNQDFNVIEFSFVLFIKYKGNIYCVIGGSGISVIKKYIDSSYGLDLYQHFAKPTDDVILELNTRGIASNVSQKKQTFNLNQSLQETLEYSEIPTKIKLQVREELKKTIFKEFNLDSGLVLMEVGSYFLIRKKINFEDLKRLIVKLDEIKLDENFSQITLFKTINSEDLISKLEDELKNIIIEDVLAHRTPDRAKFLQKDVIEVVHPTKLEKFYECDKFLIKQKNSRGKNDLEISNRSELYFESTKHIFQNIEGSNQQFEIKKKLYTTNIAGYIENKQTTYANFFTHITAEIDYLGKKYFRIDTKWYYLDDVLLKIMTKDAIDYYLKYRFEEGFLQKWPEGVLEDDYNKLHKSDNSFVLDKILKDNVELCDILYVKDDTVYFIHVKNGFNTKMRELYIQTILSAKRLANDLRNSEGSSYLNRTLKKYNEINPEHEISMELVNMIRSKDFKVVFVMAFRNYSYKGSTIPNKIKLSNSNIAKYSLVQVVREIQALEFDINLFDISEMD